MIAAESYAFQHHLRAADAIHLASAALSGRADGSDALIIVSSDVELLAAAGAVGLPTMNPATII